MLIINIKVKQGAVRMEAVGSGPQGSTRNPNCPEEGNLFRDSQWDTCEEEKSYWCILMSNIRLEGDILGSLCKSKRLSLVLSISVQLSSLR